MRKLQLVDGVDCIRYTGMATDAVQIHIQLPSIHNHSDYNDTRSYLYTHSHIHTHSLIHFHSHTFTHSHVRVSHSVFPHGNTATYFIKDDIIYTKHYISKSLKKTQVFF